MGFNVKLQRPVKSKVTRFAPFSSVAQAGFVNVVKAEWNKEYFDELEIFDGNGKHHDDMADATSDCFTLLNKQLVLPTFSLEDFSREPPFIAGPSVHFPSSGLTLPSSSF